MSRLFFEQIDDELRGMVGPTLRNYSSQVSGNIFKAWFLSAENHFEVQLVSAKWSPTGKPVFEVGLHLEGTTEANETIANALRSAKKTWSRSLPNAEIGPAFGPRGKSWIRVSETTEPSGIEDDLDEASELAYKLSAYIKNLLPQVELST